MIRRAVTTGRGNPPQPSTAETWHGSYSGAFGDIWRRESRDHRSEQPSATLHGGGFAKSASRTLHHRNYEGTASGSRSGARARWGVAEGFPHCALLYSSSSSLLYGSRARGKEYRGKPSTPSTSLWFRGLKPSTEPSTTLRNPPPVPKWIGGRVQTSAARGA